MALALHELLNGKASKQGVADAVVQSSQIGASGGRSEHYAFFEEKTEPAELPSKANQALKEAKVNAKPTKVFSELNGFSVQLDDTEAGQLREVPSIQSVELDRPLPLSPPVEVKPVSNTSPQSAPVALEAQANPNPLDQEVRLEEVFVGEVIANQAQQQWEIGQSALPIYSDGNAQSGEILPYGVKAIWGGQDVSAKGNVGKGTYAFVIDSGVLDTTGDLLINKAWSKSWVNGEGAFTDGNGHGTHVAGTIAALANNIGVVGVAPGAEVISLKVFDSNGGGASYSTIIDAVNYATQIINSNGLDKSKCVINMSLGGGFSSGLDSAVKAAANQGIKFAIAAGNSGSDADGYSPAAAGDHPNVYTVSAVDSQYKMASWSNWDDPNGGDDVDFAAPGVSVRSYYKGGNLAYLSGTSMAAPHVAGALLMGGVKAGDMVQANAAGFSDPFALVQVNGNPSPPPPTPPKPDPNPDNPGTIKITFNDLNPPSREGNSVDPIGNNYKGLDWVASCYYMDSNKNSLYRKGGYGKLTDYEGDYVAFGAWQRQFSATTRGEDFNLQKGTYAAAWNNDLNLKFTAYDDGAVVGTANIVLDPKAVEIDFSKQTAVGADSASFWGTFNSIDRITIDSSGGYSAGLGGGGSHFATDDWFVSFGKPPVDNGNAEFKIIGNARVGLTVQAQQIKDDPDGNGAFSYSWEASSDQGKNWRTVGQGISFKIPTAQSGQQLRLRVQYQDGEGFKENIATAAVSIPLNEIIGTPGGDYFFGENGSSKYTFGGGYDIMDYSSMSAPITLVRGGKVDKGVNGTDSFADFPEELIATSSLNDWVDGLTGGGKIASLDVNLAADSLKVSGIPEIGSASITIRDFEHVKGSDTADTMVGNALANKLYGNGGNDVIDGGAGNDDIQGGTGDDVLKGGTGNDSLSGGDGADRIDGGTGNDTVDCGGGNDVMLASVGNDTCTFGSGYDTADYTSFYRDITLVKGGSVNKGGLGTDTFKDFVESIKATTRANDWIDASTGNTANVDVNLSSQSLKVSGLPKVGTFTFNVQNFEHVKGSEGNDRIQGDSKANILIGNGGNDVMTASAGNDTYTFGSGYDTIDYSSLGQSIRLVRGGTVDKGGQGKDTFTDFYESIKASTDSGDWIDGITGGGAIASLNADLANQSLTISNLPGIGTVSVNVQNFENIDGSDTTDRLKGDSGSNILRGNGGNDVMLASAGNDTYTFGSGSDTIDYSSLGQAITLNKGGTVSKGSAGKDTFTDFFETIRASSGSNDWIDGSGGTTASIDANLASQKLSIKGIPGLGTVNTTVQNFENVRGTNYNDTIAGDSGNNILIGDGGNDTISTGGGRDSVDAGSGNDTITVTSAQGGSSSVTTGSGQDTVVFTKGYYQSLFYGGAAALTITDFTTGVGGDLLDLSQLFRDVAVGFDGSNPFLNGYLDFVKSGTDMQLQFDADGAFDTAFSAKTIALLKNTKRTDLDKSNFNPAYEIPPPIIQGTNRSEKITGSDEGEWIYAYNGFDTVEAKEGDDRLYGGYGNDTLNGGDGNDEIYGEMDDDKLYGGNGDDRLTGGDGADYLDGGNGSDTYIVDDERDTIVDSGTDSGIDTVIYRYYSKSYSLTKGIEKIVLPTSVKLSSMKITGNASHNSIETGDKNDILEGGAGNDLLNAALGDDTINGGSGRDTAQFSGRNNCINLNTTKWQNTGDGRDRLISIENVNAGSGNDIVKGNRSANTLNGQNGDDKLYGGNGNDVMYGGNHNDYLHGGSGTDTAQFSGRSNRINLNSTRWQNTRDGRDRLISIENVNAGSGNDVVTGNRGANTLNGQNGNDVLNGGSGNDKLVGGQGNDKLVGGQGNDKLWGQGGRDTFVLSEGAGYDRIMDFRNGQDRIQIGSGVDSLRIKNHRNGHAYVYEGRDLMAVVNGAAGDLQVKDNFLV
ncbi:Uncharacterized protein wiht hemolysin-type calcium-binding regions [Synechococcus sp. RCC307]|nr:Uncharacterized protein wiht hemolysin-type calcium-binding regions [Synechococcus sp. RCC307]